MKRELVELKVLRPPLSCVSHDTTTVENILQNIFHWLLINHNPEEREDLSDQLSR